MRLLLLSLELGLEGSGHFWWGWAGKVHVNLEAVVDEPLESGQGTDHDDTGHETLPYTYNMSDKEKNID